MLGNFEAARARGLKHTHKLKPKCVEMFGLEISLPSIGQLENLPQDL